MQCFISDSRILFVPPFIAPQNLAKKLMSLDLTSVTRNYPAKFIGEIENM